MGEFNEDEQAELPALLENTVKIIEGFCTIGIQRTMTQFNN